MDVMEQKKQSAMSGEKTMATVTPLIRNTQLRDRSSKSYRETSQSYREKPATPNSPSGSSVTTMYDHLLSPASPEAEDEKDERLRNDLLDEICNDMGIDDSMDLDFDDFYCPPAQQQQQRSARFKQPAISTTPKTENSDIRRTSVSTAGNYATSDSLCAMAKLTQSITSDGPVLSAGEESSMPDETGSEDIDRSTAAACVKREPSLNDSCGDETSDMGVSDDAKCATAAKIAAQRRNSPYTETSGATKRRQTTDEEVSQENLHTTSANSVLSTSYQQQSAANSMSTAPGPWQQASSYQGAQQQQRNTTCDYSYSEDFTMEDLTAPDTTINFSKMPQPANYYQLPQSANDTLNLSFSMSLQQSHGYVPTGVPSSGPASLPTQPFQCRPFNAMSPQLQQRSVQPQQLSQQFQTSGQQMQPGYLQQSSSAPSSMQPAFGSRQEPFPAANASVHGTPPQTPTTVQPKPPQQQSTPGNNSAAGFSGQQNFMQRLVTDKSSAFRSHPLFPLLRDLIIADMNFHEPTFPHQLICNLPSDFNKLLKNYLFRNPPLGNYKTNQSVESVVMDALKYAHHRLIEKIQQKKDLPSQHQQPLAQPAVQENGQAPAADPQQPAMGSINDYCAKFEDSVRQDMASSTTQPSQPAYGRSMSVQQQQQSPGFRSPGSRMRVSTSTSSVTSRQGPMYDMGGMSSQQPDVFSQPLSVDTGCVSVGPPTVPMNSHMSQSVAAMYQTQHQQPQTTQYNSAHVQQGGFSRSMSQPASNQRNTSYMPGPVCPPPNYTVSASNPPIPRQHQGMYDMYGQLTHDASSIYDQSGYCMPPPAHNRVMHNAHMMYVNNVNDCAMVKTMMGEGRPGDMYNDNMADNAGVMSAHAMAGVGKNGQPGQGKTPEGRKHASLPKEAVNIMLTWLREHQDKPYPNDDEKGMLIKQTGLSITQINYWFTNARRRLLPKWRGEDL